MFYFAVRNPRARFEPGTRRALRSIRPLQGHELKCSPSTPTSSSRPSGRKSKATQNATVTVWSNADCIAFCRMWRQVFLRLGASVTVALLQTGTIIWSGVSRIPVGFHPVWVPSLVEGSTRSTEAAAEFGVGTMSRRPRLCRGTSARRSSPSRF